jgi:hypothetical protein
VEDIDAFRLAVETPRFDDAPARERSFRRSTAGERNPEETLAVHVLISVRQLLLIAVIKAEAE